MAKNKTKKMATGLLVAALSFSLSGCGTNSALPPEPDSQECDDWDWDYELGVYQCDDVDSPNYLAYFYAGRMFKSKSSLTSNSNYKNYTNSSTFKGTNSGFGSGSKGGSIGG